MLSFKVDENLPVEYATELAMAGFNADTVEDESLSGADDTLVMDRCAAEVRILVTLDLDFSNIHNFPPHQHNGIIVVRSKHQDKRTLLVLLHRLLPLLKERSPSRELWIVEEDRVRFRS